MTTPRPCQPVHAARALRLTRPGSVGAHRPTPALTGAGQVARPITLPALTGAPAADIRDRVRAFHLETLPDWSGSTFSLWGGDPHDAIGAAAASLYQWLARHGGGTAGVLPWGTTPATHLALGPVPVKKNLKQLTRATRDRVNLGGNDLPAALRAATHRTATLDPAVTATYWIPTDGIEPVTTETLDALAALPPGSVHLVLIDPLHGCTPDLETQWRALPFGSITRIDTPTVPQIATTIAELAATALNLHLATLART